MPTHPCAPSIVTSTSSSLPAIFARSSTGPSASVRRKKSAASSPRKCKTCCWPWPELPEPPVSQCRSPFHLAGRTINAPKTGPPSRGNGGNSGIYSCESSKRCAKSPLWHHTHRKNRTTQDLSHFNSLSIYVCPYTRIDRLVTKVHCPPVPSRTVQKTYFCLNFCWEWLRILLSVVVKKSLCGMKSPGAAVTEYPG